MALTPKARRFWPLFFLVLLTDCATKRAAEMHLLPAHVPHEFLGEIVRLTLAYNPGAAMSFSLGAHSRIGLSLLALGALLVMAYLYRRTAPGDLHAPGARRLRYFYPQRLHRDRPASGTPAPSGNDPRPKNTRRAAARSGGRRSAAQASSAAAGERTAAITRRRRRRVRKRVRKAAPPYAASAASSPVAR